MSTCKHGFNIGYQTWATQGLNSHVCMVHHAMYTIDIWNMFLHQLNGDTIPHTLKNNNPICFKTNQFVDNVYFIRAPKINKIEILHNQVGYTIFGSGSIYYLLQIDHNWNPLPFICHIHMDKKLALIINCDDFVNICWNKCWFLDYNFDCL